MAILFFEKFADETLVEGVFWGAWYYAGTHGQLPRYAFVFPGHPAFFRSVLVVSFWVWEIQVRILPYVEIEDPNLIILTG